MMEMTVELMVFLGIGIILLGMFTMFIYQWNIKDDVDTLGGLYQDNGTAPALKIDLIEFMTRAKEFWDYCNHTYANESRRYVVFNNSEREAGSLNKTILFGYYRSLSFCQSIQSANQSCGRREDVNMSTIELPSVVTLRCMNETLYISLPNETI
jgi:hypothetical protein